MTPVNGAILAGGRSRRMGGVQEGLHKALQPLAGKPLLSHVIRRLQPQCGQLLLSVEKTDHVWEAFGLRQVADLRAGSQGPVGGVLAVLETLQQAGESWLLLAPCDAPFMPPDLAQRLIGAAEAEQAPAALASYRQQWQPTFSLWHTRLLPELRVAVLEQGQRGMKEFLQTVSVAVVEWQTSEPDLMTNPFFNINTPDDLAAAAALLDRTAGPIS